MPKFETLKTKTLGDGLVIQINHVQYAYFKNDAVADIFEVSCYKKGDKSNRIAAERFLTGGRALSVLEKRAASPDPLVLSGDKNNVNIDLIERIA